MMARLDLEFIGGGLSGKGGRGETSTALTKFASPSVSERVDVPPGVTRAELAD